MNTVTVVLVLLGCIASAMTGDCNTLQRTKVKYQWSIVYGATDNRQAFGTLVWRDFFGLYPDRSLFSGVRGENIYSPEFRAHVVRVFAGFDILISLLDQEDILNSALAHYAAFHKQFPSIPFKEFGVVLLEALAKTIPEQFDQDAWSQCYAVIVAGVTA
uniref:Extracellular globin n=1 Tax=Platynereis dumerilii TaxID=6359 RepID=A0A7T8CLZ7_PLADU|nr:extracellular globin Egb_A1c [Platynereis dumerilii]